MSQSRLTAEDGITWASDGISEVLFWVCTDQDQDHCKPAHRFMERIVVLDSDKIDTLLTIPLSPVT